MTKRFRGSDCVYCGAPGGTADHIFARKFFPVEQRDNLPQVSACSSCNSDKAQLESYLLALLPFGGNHPSSSDLLTEMVPRRLEKNLKLHRTLSEGRQDILVQDGDEIRETLILPFEGEKLASLLRYVARGLVAHHWGSPVPSSYYVGGGVLTEYGDAIMRDMFVKRAAARVQGDMGDGLFLYEGAQAVDDPHLTLWRFQIYGGIMVSDPDVSMTAAHSLWALTARKGITGLFDE